MRTAGGADGVRWWSGQCWRRRGGSKQRRARICRIGHCNLERAENSAKVDTSVRRCCVTSKSRFAGQRDRLRDERQIEVVDNGSLPTRSVA